MFTCFICFQPIKHGQLPLLMNLIAYCLWYFFQFYLQERLKKELDKKLFDVNSKFEQSQLVLQEKSQEVQKLNKNLQTQVCKFVSLLFFKGFLTMCCYLVLTLFCMGTGAATSPLGWICIYEPILNIWMRTKG